MGERPSGTLVNHAIARGVHDSEKEIITELLAGIFSNFASRTSLTLRNKTFTEDSW